MYLLPVFRWWRGRPETAGCCVAGRSTTMRTTPAARTATTTTPTTNGTTTAVGCVWRLITLQGYLPAGNVARQTTLRDRGLESKRGLFLAEALFPWSSTLAEPGSGEYRIAPAPGCKALGRGDFLNAGESTPAAGSVRDLCPTEK